MNPTRRLIMISLILTLLAGFSYRFEIIVHGLDTRQPVFVFSKPLLLPPRWTRKKVELDSFLIVSKQAGEWDYRNPVWAIDIKPGATQQVDEITFGVIPPDFTQTTKAKSLSPGVEYLALGFGPGASGSKEFMLTDHPSEK